MHPWIQVHIHAQDCSSVSGWNTRLSPFPMDESYRGPSTTRPDAITVPCTLAIVERIEQRCVADRAGSPCSAAATNRKCIAGIRQHEKRCQLRCFRSSGDRPRPLWRMRLPRRSGRRSAFEANRNGGGSHRRRSGARYGSCVVGYDAPRGREFLAEAGYFSTALQHL